MAWFAVLWALKALAQQPEGLPALGGDKRLCTNPAGLVVGALFYLKEIASLLRIGYQVSLLIPIDILLVQQNK